MLLLALWNIIAYTDKYKIKGVLKKLESKLKKWNGKKVKMEYIHIDKEGNVYNPIVEFEELKKDILKQGFTFTEKENTIELNETNQFFWKPRQQTTVGTFNARATKYELLEGKTVLISGDYPIKKNIIDHGEDFFYKKGYGDSNVKYTLLER